MLVIPAIDLRKGRCVRLLQGKFDAVTDYSGDPLSIAQAYEKIGCPWLHVVDLDGAETGNQNNSEQIRQIILDTRLKIQLGGGIRSRDTAESLFSLGASRLVIGSRAIEDPESVRQWLQDFGPERIALALDIRLSPDGIPLVTTHGWTRDSDVSLAAAIREFSSAGLKHVLCTDVSRDGAMTGPNTSLYEVFATGFPDIALQASGGVGNAQDLYALAAAGVDAAITGKALLEKTISDEELLLFLRDE